MAFSPGLAANGATGLPVPEAAVLQGGPLCTGDAVSVCTQLPCDATEFSASQQVSAVAAAHFSLVEEQDRRTHSLSLALAQSQGEVMRLRHEMQANAECLKHARRSVLGLQSERTALAQAVVLAKNILSSIGGDPLMPGAGLAPDAARIAGDNQRAGAPPGLMLTYSSALPPTGQIGLCSLGAAADGDSASLESIRQFEEQLAAFAQQHRHYAHVLKQQQGALVTARENGYELLLLWERESRKRIEFEAETTLAHLFQAQNFDVVRKALLQFILASLSYPFPSCGNENEMQLGQHCVEAEGQGMPTAGEGRGRVTTEAHEYSPGKWVSLAAPDSFTNASSAMNFLIDKLPHSSLLDVRPFSHSASLNPAIVQGLQRLRHNKELFEGYEVRLGDLKDAMLEMELKLSSAMEACANNDLDRSLYIFLFKTLKERIELLVDLLLEQRSGFFLFFTNFIADMLMLSLFNERGRRRRDGSHRKMLAYFNDTDRSKLLHEIGPLSRNEQSTTTKKRDQVCRRPRDDNRIEDEPDEVMLSGALKQLQDEMEAMRTVNSQLKAQLCQHRQLSAIAQRRATEEQERRATDAEAAATQLREALRDTRAALSRALQTSRRSAAALMESRAETAKARADAAQRSEALQAALLAAHKETAEARQLALTERGTARQLQERCEAGAALLEASRTNAAALEVQLRSARVDVLNHVEELRKAQQALLALDARHHSEVANLRAHALEQQREIGCIRTATEDALLRAEAAEAERDQLREALTLPISAINNTKSANANRALGDTAAITFSTGDDQHSAQGHALPTGLVRSYLVTPQQSPMTAKAGHAVNNNNNNSSNNNNNNDSNNNSKFKAEQRQAADVSSMTSAVMKRLAALEAANIELEAQKAQLIATNEQLRRVCELSVNESVELKEELQRRSHNTSLS